MQQYRSLFPRDLFAEIDRLQRDLQRLSGPFSLIDEEEGGRKQWSHAKNAPLDLRDMEPATALALYLAEGHLKNLLPQSVLDLLGPQFNKARNYLGELGENSLAQWAQCVRTLPNGKALQPAEVSPAVWQETSTALLERKQAPTMITPDAHSIAQTTPTGKAIAQVVEAAGKAAGAKITLTDYVRFQLGEGIEKEESDFAAEVAAAVKG